MPFVFVFVWFAFVIGAESNIESLFNCEANESACTSISNCTAQQAAIRSGIKCNSFPFYSGSVRLFDYHQQWSSPSQSVSTCTSSRSDARYCSRWTQLDAVHSPHCKCTNNEHHYCASWECQYAADQQISEWCHCTDAHHSGAEWAYCSKWICNRTEYQDIHSVVVTAADIQIVHYQCTSNEPQNAYSSEYIHFRNEHSPTFCWQWIGNSVLVHPEQSTWSVMECECEIPKVHTVGVGQARLENVYCSNWICWENEMEYHRIPRKQWFLSLTITSTAGAVVLLIIRLAAYQWEWIEDWNPKWVKVGKWTLNVLLVLSMFTLCFCSFIFGGILSALITVVFWIMIGIGGVFCVMGRQMVERRKEEKAARLRRDRSEFVRQRNTYFSSDQTASALFRYPSAALFRYPTTDSLQFRYAPTDDDSVDHFQY